MESEFQVGGLEGRGVGVAQAYQLYLQYKEKGEVTANFVCTQYLEVYEVVCVYYFDPLLSSPSLSRARSGYCYLVLLFPTQSPQDSGSGFFLLP